MMGTTTPKVHMGRLAGADARALLAANPVILLPMGSHEDQGPHAPMGDYLLAEKIAELAAVRATAAGAPTFVAPVLPFGGADYFGPMIGGIALSPDTLTRVITDMVAGLHRNGLTRLVVINGHGGNVRPIAEVARAVYRERGIIMPSLYLWRIAAALMPQLFGAEHAAQAAGHGADPLTSIGLHLQPELMRTDSIPAAAGLQRDKHLDLDFIDLGAASFEGAEVGMPQEYDEVYNQGVGRGDARLCSAEHGKVLTEKLVEITARFAAHFAARCRS